MESKICKKCGINKNINEYGKHKSYSSGYKNVCKICLNLEYKNWVLNNQEKYKTNVKKSHEKNKEKEKEYRVKNREKLLKYKKEYYKKNKKSIIEKNNNRQKILRQTSELHKLKANVANIIRSTLKYKGVKKTIKSLEILGCSYEEFKTHLETQFEPWMNWDNYGLYNGEFNYGWDIDHIIPSSYGTTEDDVLKLNHYSNLRPLCSKTNRDIKKNKLI